MCSATVAEEGGGGRGYSRSHGSIGERTGSLTAYLVNAAAEPQIFRRWRVFLMYCGFSRRAYIVGMPLSLPLLLRSVGANFLVIKLLPWKRCGRRQFLGLYAGDDSRFQSSPWYRLPFLRSTYEAEAASCRSHYHYFITLLLLLPGLVWYLLPRPV